MNEVCHICEVGPRDGLQILRSVMPTAAKLRWIEALVAAGLREIEVGSFVPAKLIPQMADTAEVVAAACRLPGLKVVALAPNLRGAQAAHAAGAHRISVPVSASRGHSLANLNREPAAQIEEVARIVAWVRAQSRAMEVEGAVSTAFGCSIDGVVPARATLGIVEGLQRAGVDAIALADTVGYANPAQITALLRDAGGAIEGLHLHDTMGLGLANALAGLQAGIRNFDAALAGLGGCPFAPGASGNIVTEDLVFMLESMGFATGIDLDRLIAARAALQAGLPGEALRGQVPQAGIPKTYRQAA